MSKYNANIINAKTGIAIPINEPVFIVRGKDKYAIPTIEAYEQIITDSTVPPSLLFSLDIIKEEILLYQKIHKRLVRQPN